MQFRGDGTDSAGDITLTPDNWNIPVSTNLDIQAQVKLAKQTQEASKSNIATVSWSFNWKDATDVPDVPDTSAISHNWQDGTPMLAGSNKDVTFDWSSTADTNSIASVESSEPDVASIDPKAISTLVEGQAAYTVTGKSVGTTTITATLTSGESTSFDVTVNEIKPGTGGDGDDIEITIPGDTLQPGDKLDPDMEIEIPVTGPDGDTTVTVKPEIPDTELKPGDNEIQVEVDINGVKVTIIIKVTVEGGSSNPSDGLDMTIQDAQAMGFTFSSYEDGLKIDSFENKQFKKEINVPEQIGDFKVLKIGDNVFKNQTNLTKITLPSTVKEIGSNTFKGCSGISEISISSNVTTVGEGAFYEAGAEDSTIIIDCNGIESLLEHSKFKHAIIGDNVTSIGNYQFKDCKYLTSIILSDSINAIGYHAFAGCEALTEAIIPEGVTVLENGVYKNCTSLTKVSIPNSVTSIGMNTFDSCVNLRSVTIPESVTSIDYRAFYNVPHIEYHGSASGAPWGAKSMN